MYYTCNNLLFSFKNKITNYKECTYNFNYNYDHIKTFQQVEPISNTIEYNSIIEKLKKLYSSTTVINKFIFQLFIISTTYKSS